MKYIKFIKLREVNIMSINEKDFKVERRKKAGKEKDYVQKKKKIEKSKW